MHLDTRIVNPFIFLILRSILCCSTIPHNFIINTINKLYILIYSFNISKYVINNYCMICSNCTLNCCINTNTTFTKFCCCLLLLPLFLSLVVHLVYFVYFVIYFHQLFYQMFQFLKNV